MVNPAALFNPHIPAAMLGRHRRRVRPQPISNAAVFLLSTAGSIVIYYGGAANPSGGSRAGDEPAYALLAFLLSLLGIWLVLLALVADRFPGAAALATQAIAMALNGYFFGGGRRND